MLILYIMTALIAALIFYHTVFYRLPNQNDSFRAFLEAEKQINDIKEKSNVKKTR
ncbi:hypothetical protein [Pasteurella phage PHB01]|uniref:Uncharacterized protein n=1 Tax=Pasteurella phage PHB01 TaxID=2006930 RepID=A0A218M4F3_9CAUD|nr:hypothetical protein HOR83_gp17 [Pasteurella phage PHB01]ASD51031.1 hypothetical protein [Pasteurella phage PHB01]